MRTKKNRRIFIWLPLGVAFAMMAISYLISNMSWTIGNEKTIISKFEYRRQHRRQQLPSEDTSALFINVSHDRQLVPYYDTVIGIAGTNPIVDRSKLLKLLQALEEDTSYRYVILDVLFDTVSHTPSDSALFSTIARMQRIVVPCDTAAKAIPLLQPKSGLAIYHTSLVETDFLKYPYLIGDSASMALHVYEELCQNRTLRRYGPLYMDRWPAHRCVALTFDALPNHIYNLGAEILKDSLAPGEAGMGLIYDSVFKEKCVRDKYVVIGSFEGDDMHNTYLGMLPGPVINYNAALTLLRGGHMVNPWVAVLMFLLYYVICLTIFNSWTLTGKLLDNKYAPIRVLGIILTLINYSVWLSAFCIFAYVRFDVICDVYIIASLFALIEVVTRIVKIVLKKKKE